MRILTNADRQADIECRCNGQAQPRGLRKDRHAFFELNPVGDVLSDEQRAVHVHIIARRQQLGDRGDAAACAALMAQHLPLGEKFSPVSSARRDPQSVEKGPIAFDYPIPYRNYSFSHLHCRQARIS
jgi:hypothetical protein